MIAKAVLAGLMALVAHDAMAAAVVPHRAVYDVGLLRAREGVGIGSVSGLLAYEVLGSACDGWTVNFRWLNQFSYMEGNSRLIDSQSSSWETGDGLKLNYLQKGFIDNKPDGEKRLSVTRAEKGGPGEGVISLPSDKTFTISGETVFPMRHQLRLMEAAEKGAVRDVSVVYDGSDSENSVRAISTIGGRVNAGGVKEDGANPAAAQLHGLPSWPVNISYYALAESDVETPIYEASFQMYENGVSTAIVLNYGDYVLSGRLKRLELIEAEICQ